MASPFDLYQSKQFQGLDPNRFNKEAYAEQQRQLFADTFKDQLGTLGQSYQQQIASAKENEAKLEEASKQLQDLNSKTKDFESNFKSAESKYKSAESNYKSAQNYLNTARNEFNSVSSTFKNYQRAVDNARSRAVAATNNANRYENELRKSYSKVYAGYREPYKSQVIKKIINSNRNYQNLIKERDRLNNIETSAINNLSSYRNVYNRFESELQRREKALSYAEQQFKQESQLFNQVNQQLNQHKQQIGQVSSQVNQFNNALGGANKEAERALQEASTIQQKIQEYQTRSEPLKNLESQIQGNYEDAAKASIEELKQIAANNLDPISQKNAQNLLNQRAEQLAQTFGKNVEDVKKEMGIAVGQLKGEQFATQEDFNKFMGIEAQKTAELQEEAILNNQIEQPVAEITAPIQQPAVPKETTLQISEPVQVQPAPQAAIPPSPVQPQPIPQVQAQAPQTQQIQQQTQAQTTGAPKLPAPQAAPTQPQNPAQPQAQAEATGMPKLPAEQSQFGGTLNNQLRQGFQRQLQQGFQNAMKIKATPKPKQQVADPIADRRKAVASQALGVASKPTSVSKPVGSAFDKNQNININQQQSSVNKGVGRRPVR